MYLIAQKGSIRNRHMEFVLYVHTIGRHGHIGNPNASLLDRNIRIRRCFGMNIQLVVCRKRTMGYGSRQTRLGSVALVDGSASFFDRIVVDLCLFHLLVHARQCFIDIVL